MDDNNFPGIKRNTFTGLVRLKFLSLSNSFSSLRTLTNETVLSLAGCPLLLLNLTKNKISNRREFHMEKLLNRKSQFAVMRIIPVMLVMVMAIGMIPVSAKTKKVQDIPTVEVSSIEDLVKQMNTDGEE